MKNMDLVKMILIASIVLCLAGLGLFIYQKHDLNKLNTAMPLCINKLTMIGEISAEVELRKTELVRDKRQGEKLHSYVDKQAKQAGINYTKYLNMKPMGENPDRIKGFTDFPNEIKPSSKKLFSRKLIANFIFNLENFTNRLKVTELYMDKPSEDCEEWNMNMRLTERAPLEKQ
ncbi:MAG: hypothetical protein ABIK28_00645 [Planctomycetota bacterium]